MNVSYIFISALGFLLFVEVDGSCVVPNDLQGTWEVEGRANNLVFTPSMLIGVKLDQFPGIVFNCYFNSGTRFVFKSNAEKLFGESVKIYFCVDFESVSPSSYQMWELTNKVGLYYDERARAFLISDDPNVKFADVCQHTRDTTEFKMLTKVTQG